MFTEHNSVMYWGILPAEDKKDPIWDIQLFQDHYVRIKDPDGPEKRAKKGMGFGNCEVVEYMYRFRTVPENIFWKTLKMMANDFQALVTKPDLADGGPYESGQNLLNFLKVDEPYWNRIRRLTYEEAFKIEDRELQTQVFGGINVREMIEHLGYEKVKVDGKHVTRRQYREDGTYEMIENDVIYELLKVEVSKLLGDDARVKTYRHAIKCWCTSTGKDHYLWIEDQYATDPLTGIASTCRLQEDLIPHIDTIKRQGDLFLLEFKDGFDPEAPGAIDPAKPKRPLTAEEYFGLLVAES